MIVAILPFRWYTAHKEIIPDIGVPPCFPDMDQPEEQNE
jgi:hypothetical protein